MAYVNFRKTNEKKNKKLSLVFFLFKFELQLCRHWFPDNKYLWKISFKFLKRTSFRFVPKHKIILMLIQISDEIKVGKCRQRFSRDNRLFC